MFLSLFRAVPALLLALTVTLSLPGAAASSEPEPVRVAGTVLTSDTGLPVPGVTVEVEGRALTATTNSLGVFFLNGLTTDGGAVTLRFSRIGFATKTEVVELTTSAGTRRVEIRMEPRAVELAPLSVLLERTRMVGDPLSGSAVPGSAFHLSRTDLTSLNSAFGNVHDMLRTVPGVNIQDEEGYGSRPNIGLRGAGADRSGNVTLMEDGVLIAPAPYSAPAAYYFPTAARMEGIEVRKGASQVRYGPRTLGGAINMISSTIPERRSWFAEVAGGGDTTLKTHLRVGDATTHTGWLLEGYQLRTDGFKNLQGGGDTGFDTRDLMGKFRVNSRRDAPRYQELELKLGFTLHVADETYLGLTEADFRAAPNFRYAGSQEDVLDTEHRQGQLRYFLQMSPRTDLVVTAYRNEFARNWYKLQTVMGRGLSTVLNNPEAHADAMAVLRGADSADGALRIRANNREYLSQGVQGTFGFRPTWGAVRHNVEVGLRYHTDSEDRFQWEDGYRMTNGRMVLTSAGAGGSQENRLGEAEALAFFIQDEIRVGRWAFVPGVRWESIDFTRIDWERTDGNRTGPTQVRTNSVSELIPGVGATYELSPWTHFFGGVHRGFGPPGPGANEETRAEASINYEAGVRVRRAAAGLNVTGFFSDYRNILGRATLATGESGSGELFNGGAVEVWGVEAAVDADLSRALNAPVSLPVRATYTYTRGSFGSSFVSGFGPWGTVEAGDRLPYLPEHLFSGSVGAEDAGWALRLGWTGAGAMRTEAGTGPIAEGTGADRFVVFNLTGELAAGGQGTVFATVQNLTDREYVVSRRPSGARPGLPRTVQIGFRVTH